MFKIVYLPGKKVELRHFVGATEKNVSTHFCFKANKSSVELGGDNKFESCIKIRSKEDGKVEFWYKLSLKEDC